MDDDSPTHAIFPLVRMVTSMRIKKEREKGCINPLFETKAIVASLGGRGGILDPVFLVQ